MSPELLPVRLRPSVALVLMVSAITAISAMLSIGFIYLRRIVDDERAPSHAMEPQSRTQLCAECVYATSFD